MHSNVLAVEVKVLGSRLNQVQNVMMVAIAMAEKKFLASLS